MNTVTDDTYFIFANCIVYHICGPNHFDLAHNNDALPTEQEG